MKEIKKSIPTTPGVYIFKDKKGKKLYVGKAGNLNKRVKSYFSSKDIKTKKMLSEAFDIDFVITDTVIESLILEAKLIKEYKPFYNIKDKDDRSFLYLVFTKETFSRPILVRKKEAEKFKEYFGPFTSSKNIYEAMRVVRKIFPYSTHKEGLKFKKPCFEYEIGLCPGTCFNLIEKKDYLKNIRDIKDFFKGKKKSIIKKLKKEMSDFSKKEEFEKALKTKRKINALLHIRDTFLITKNNIEEKNIKGRWEGYDISNISGDFAVGSMAVFTNRKPDKKEYKLFKIKTIKKVNDTAMLKEVIERRFKNNWTFPDLILIDGGKGQKNIVEKTLDNLGIRIPVVSIAKGKERKKNQFFGRVLEEDKKPLIMLRDEAHRFAINYHRKIRGKSYS